MSSPETTTLHSLPNINQPLMNGFDIFLPRYLRKHFHSVALNRATLSPEVFAADVSLVIYVNHASWWDPLIAHYLRKRVFKNYHFYAPIDAAALARYRIFKSMGFYGIEANSLRGAQDFLRLSKRILMEQQVAICMTPEGRFCDVRDFSAPFMPGIAHLATMIERWSAPLPSSREVWFVPAAFELAFWEERLPECLCWFGEPIVARWGARSASHTNPSRSGSQDRLQSTSLETHDRSSEKEQWNTQLVSRLRSAQQQLAAASISRDTSQFEVLLSGASGTWQLYDWGRQLMSKLRGERLQLDHGKKLTSAHSRPK